MDLKNKTASIIFFFSFLTISIQACLRRPQGATGDSSAVDENFRITIDGNPATYIPGQIYNISLSCDIAFKFISFTLVSEPEPGAPYGLDMAGHFEIIDTAETRFSKLCENMVESSNTNIKHRADVAWVAPTNPNSTCVYFKAAVLQHRYVWFIDDGFLTKRICPEEIDDVNSQTPLVNPCCACDEAKYELVVERRWTRNTHAKDFPQDDWRTRFSELIGASHTYDDRFWAYGSPASPGLKEIAEHGATKTLENEIKERAENGSVRTIIKAPGVQFRKNVMSSTLATVRVDPRHHLVSIVTKIIPSPDWILGVAGLELCLANCTWIDEKILSLFPWDVGTDSGPSYMSPDQQQVPPDVVRRITSTFPSDYRSPFYDETGAPMKPMATLYMTRKKIYERECEEDNNVPLECATHPWVDWTECSAKCGAGTQYRERNYKDVGLAARYNCEVVLRQTQRCIGTQCGVQEDDEEFGPHNAECELTNWSNWGPCSKSCGRGFTKRIRNYRNPYARENCLAGFPVELEQTQECMGNNCGGTITDAYDNNNSEFDQYSREPGLMEEDSVNTGYDRGSQFSVPNKPGRFNEKWNAEERYSNRQPTFGDIDQNAYGINNGENEQQGANFGYGNNNGYNSYSNKNSKQQNRLGQNFGFENNYENNLNTNNYNNQQWMSSNNNRQENIHKSPYDNMDNDLSNGNIGVDNGNNYDTYRNKQIPYDNLNNDNSNNNNDLLPPAYNQQIINERVTNHFQSPGFYPNKNTRYANTPAGAFDKENTHEIYDEFGRKTSPQQYNTVPQYCFEKPHVVRGTCKGRKKINNFWLFDADDRECKIFTTDNCDKNKNKFRSLELCESTCLQPQLGFEEQQFQQTLPEQNYGVNNQFGEPPLQIHPTNAYGRREQSYNQINLPRRKNRNY